MSTYSTTNRIVSLLLVPIVALALSGCYSAQVTSNQQPSGQVIEKPWATGFLFGLAMPGAQINAAQQCPNGVAKVETQVSFLNGLASTITFNLYTPMSVTVTCAAEGSMSSLMLPAPDFTIPEEAGATETADILRAAAQRSARVAEPVQIKMN